MRAGLYAAIAEQLSRGNRVSSTAEMFSARVLVAERAAPGLELPGAGKAAKRLLGRQTMKTGIRSDRPGAPQVRRFTGVAPLLGADFAVSSPDRARGNAGFNDGVSAANKEPNFQKLFCAGQRSVSRG